MIGNVSTSWGTFRGVVKKEYMNDSIAVGSIVKSGKDIFILPVGWQMSKKIPVVENTLSKFICKFSHNSATKQIWEYDIYKVPDRYKGDELSPSFTGMIVYQDLEWNVVDGKLTQKEKLTEVIHYPNFEKVGSARREYEKIDINIIGDIIYDS